MRAALFVTCLVDQFLAEIGLSMVHGTGSHSRHRAAAHNWRAWRGQLQILVVEDR